MLEIKPSCERCQKSLSADSEDAFICSFECTFCKDCVEGDLQNVCPNCGGNFAPRPIRSHPEMATDGPSEIDQFFAELDRLHISWMVGNAARAKIREVGLPELMKRLPLSNALRQKTAGASPAEYAHIYMALRLGVGRKLYWALLLICCMLFVVSAI